MSKKIVTIVYILLFVWSVANLQFFIDTAGDPNTKSIYGYGGILCLLLIECIGIAILFFNFHKKTGSTLLPIVCMWLLYSIMNTLINGTDLFKDMRATIWWSTVFILFFYIFYNDKSGKYLNLLLRLVIVLFCVFLLQFFYFRTSTVSMVNEFLYSLNQAFYPVLLLPFAFFINNKKLKYILLGAGIAVSLFSFKRSIILFVLIIFIVSLYFDFLKGRKNAIIISSLTFIILVGSFFAVFEYVDSLTDGHIISRFESLETDGGSGRLDIYEIVLSEYSKKDMIIKLIGSGHNSVIKQKKVLIFGEPLSAHNDFLEILYDFGILGLFIYLIIIAKIISLLIKSKKVSLKLYQANLAVFIIFAVMSMVSHLIIYPTYFAYLVIIWAITDGYTSRLTKKDYDIQKRN